jgi:hypothetical protein
MALTDFNEYVDKLKENRASDFNTVSSTARILRPNASWQSFNPSPATPTTSVALDKNSAQSMSPIPAVSTGRLTMLGARLSTSTLSAASMMVVDLLNVSGGLNASLTTPQTTNLPTAALTRYTSGEGVMAGIVVYNIIGSTYTTVTIDYTNSSGVSGRTSTATTFGGGFYREVGVLIPIPLQTGDTGVRSVESVTIAATTGTAGNFGVCLYKPLSMISLESATGAMPLDSVSTGCIIGSLCEIHPNACLTFSVITTVSFSIIGALILGEV